MVIPPLVPPCLHPTPMGRGGKGREGGRKREKEKPKGNRDGDGVRCYFMTSHRRDRELSFCLLSATSFRRNIPSRGSVNVMALKPTQGKEGRALHVRWTLRSFLLQTETLTTNCFK